MVLLVFFGKLDTIGGKAINIKNTSPNNQINNLISNTPTSHTIKLPYSKINNQKLTLSFNPSTKQDEDTIKSFLPNTKITDISQLPSSLPAYLIKVTPKLKLNEQSIIKGNSLFR